MQPPKIVSLISSATETVYRLGCGDWLVGRSHECDFPSEVRQLPTCSRARIDVNASSREINAQVKQRLRDSLSIYEVDVQQLQRLQPDIILTQTQCVVCAVSLEDVQQAICGLVESRPRIVSVEPQDLAGVWQSILTIADSLAVLERGQELVSELQQRLSELSSRATHRPTVGCIEWMDPLMAAGNWVPELVEIAGGKNLLGLAGKHSPWMDWQQLVAADPDVLVLMPCGWDLQRTRAELGPLLEHPLWPTLSAVRSGNVFLVDGNQYFNRPGPRLVESASILAEILHPEYVLPQHHGAGWERL